MPPAGTMTEVFVLERPVATRNAAGESVTEVVEIDVEVDATGDDK